ncbi:hypothetical protein pb186bvf_020244 [Paramecium bursaria]
MQNLIKSFQKQSEIVETKLKRKDIKLETKLMKCKLKLQMLQAFPNKQKKQFKLEAKILKLEQELHEQQIKKQIIQDFDQALMNIQKQLDYIQVLDLKAMTLEQKQYNKHQLITFSKQVKTIAMECTNNGQVHFARLLNDRINIVLNLYQDIEDDQSKIVESVVIQKQEQVQQVQKIQQQEVKNESKLNSQSDDDSSTCSMCLDQKREYIAIPCGHFIYCGTCTELLKQKLECILCRKAITQFMKVYQ